MLIYFPKILSNSKTWFRSWKLIFHNGLVIVTVSLWFYHSLFWKLVFILLHQFLFDTKQCCCASLVSFLILFLQLLLFISNKANAKQPKSTAQNSAIARELKSCCITKMMYQKAVLPIRNGSHFHWIVLFNRLMIHIST